jgi:uncharacterized protein YjbI with pentapeptide repeats
LHQSRFWDADLRDTELAEAHDLLGAQLAGANVSGAKLPAAIERFDGLRRASESAEIARPMFILVLLGCLYAFATIASTTDAALLANFRSEFLPDVSAPIPTVWFYFAMPCFLFALYVYLDLYVEQIWRAVSDLPSVFPDGTLLHRMVYPWLLVRLLSRAVSGGSMVFGADISATRAVVNVVFVILVWWLVPIALLFFGARYLPAHDWYGTSLHIALFVIAIGSSGFGIYSFETAQAMRRGFKYKTLSFNETLRRIATHRIVIAISMGIVLVGFSLGSINGVPPERADFTDVRTWVPRVLSLIGYDPFADFRDMDVSIRPANWSGIEDIGLVKGAVLRGRDLRYLDASRAFLVKADFRDSDLFGATLVEASLEGADFRGADLEDVDLSEAKLHFADFQNANLRTAIFREANLHGANLANAKLQSAKIIFGNLSEASLIGANLSEADLLGSKLQEADLSGADFQKANLRLADLQKAILTGTNMQYAVLGGASFQEALLNGASFREADLGGVDFSGADLTAADMTKASLIGANLRGAQLRRTRLEQAQLSNSDLSEATLRLAELEGAILRFTNLRLANLGGANLRKADLSGAELPWADLRSLKGQDADTLPTPTSIRRKWGVPNCSRPI